VLLLYFGPVFFWYSVILDCKDEKLLEVELGNSDREISDNIQCDLKMAHQTVSKVTDKCLLLLVGDMM
jgi:hypothetical protein